MLQCVSYQESRVRVTYRLTTDKQTVINISVMNYSNSNTLKCQKSYNSIQILAPLNYGCNKSYKYFSAVTVTQFFTIILFWHFSDVDALINANWRYLTLHDVIKY